MTRLITGDRTDDDSIARLDDPDLAKDVAAGLSAGQKTLPSKYFYDDEGSRLFEVICGLPEYYLTRAERAILERHADDIVGDLEPDARLVELGAGSATKTRLLIDALVRRQGGVVYCPIDISAQAMRVAEENVKAAFPSGVVFKGVIGEYRDALGRLSTMDQHQKLVLFLGSSIGNFTLAGATRFLAAIHDGMGPRDRLLVGLDLAKSPETLVRAYDDAQGVTAAFNKNLLVRLARELDADFDLDAFRHEARWDPVESRIEMHLVSTRRQTVHIGRLGLDVEFEEGESIHTENSYKYTPGMVARMVRESGFREERMWTDPEGRFALRLLAPA
ncbi:MAG: L-histidine N(alpha)-methyltransferase [Euryarchaeota archaeon]|nr:L-histidine N(alpha)-methyltransferase [Euryarchaeota archaeon]